MFVEINNQFMRTPEELLQKEVLPVAGKLNKANTAYCIELIKAIQQEAYAEGCIDGYEVALKDAVDKLNKKSNK
jgi:hypothetical protein